MNFPTNIIYSIEIHKYVKFMTSSHHSNYINFINYSFYHKIYNNKFQLPYRNSSMEATKSNFSNSKILLPSIIMGNKNCYNIRKIMIRKAFR